MNESSVNELKNIFKDVGNTSIWVVVGNIASLSVNFLTVKILGASSFGIVAVSISILSTIQIISSLGTERSIIKFIAHARGEGNFSQIISPIYHALSLTIPINIVIVCLYFIFRSSILSHFSHFPEYEFVLDLSIIMCPFLSAIVVLSRALNGIELQRFGYIENSFIRPIVKVVVFLLLLNYFIPIHSLIYGQIVAIISGLLFLMYRVKKDLYPFRKLQPVTTHPIKFKEFISYSTPLVLIPIFNFNLVKSDIVIIGFFQDAVSTGLYAVARQFTALMFIPLVILGGIVSPICARLYAINDIVSIERIYSVATKWSFILGAFLFSIIFVCAEEIHLIFGNEFVQGSLLLRIMIIGSLIDTSVGPSTNFLVMMNKPILVIQNTIFGAVSAFIFIILFLPDPSLVELSIAFTSSVITINVLTIYQIHKSLNINPFNLKTAFTRVLTVLLSPLVLFQVKALLSYHSYIVISVISLLAAIIVAASVYFIEGIESEESSIIKSIAKKISREKK